jgi:hypothetical protein
LPDFFAGTKKGHLKLYFNLRQPHLLSEASRLLL